MNSAKKFLQLGQLGARQICTSQVSQSSQRKVVDYTKLKAKQEKFQVADGEPVHVKGGILDKLMYQFTLALCAVGLGLSAKVLYDMSYPKRS